jgi:hypothetical protein
VCAEYGDRRDLRVEGAIMARIIRREVRERGFFGWVFLLIFLGFNALMFYWLINYWSAIGGHVTSGTEAGRTGAAIGATMATGVIFFFWAAGAVITGLLALLTRGRKTDIEESYGGSNPVDQIIGQPVLDQQKPEQWSGILTSVVVIALIVGGLSLWILMQQPAKTDRPTPATFTVIEQQPKSDSGIRVDVPLPRERPLK